MRMNKKHWLQLLALCLVVACVSLTMVILKQNKVTITLGVFAGSPWKVPDSYTYEYIEDAIEKFESANPNVSVEYISGIQKEDYSEWLSGKLVSGKAPDVFLVLPEDFSMLQSVGALKELDGIISKDRSFDSGDYYTCTYNFGNTNNHQYALPMESVPELMFVNKTLLAKETILMPDSDWTWDEFYAICQAVTKDLDQNGVIDQFGVYNYNWEHAFTTNGVSPFDITGKSCDIQGENTIEAVEFLKKLEDLKQGATVTASDFDFGKVAFMPLTLAEYRTYKPYPWHIKKYSDFDWDCVTLPRGPHGDNISKTNTLLMAMNSRTSHEKYAWELMKTFCYDREIQAEIYKYRGGGSVIREILEKQNEFLIVNQALPKDNSMNIGMIHTIMKSAISDYNFSNIQEVKDMVTKGIKDIVDNDRSSPIALKNLQREINQYLKK